MAFNPDVYGFIPARYQSSRFPGKPLADICGKPMFWHVYQQATKCPFLKKVVLATDDKRIQQAAGQFNIPAVMTRPDHPSGTDRVFEAAQNLNIPRSSIVINIQGDEPLLAPQALTRLIYLFEDTSVEVASLARAVSHQEAVSPDIVKLVCDAGMNALYFSRAVIPFYRDDADSQSNTFLAHIGLYGYRHETLARFVGLPVGKLEAIEKLEQLRLLEAGIPIRMGLTGYKTCGVDRPEDIEKVVRAVRGKK